MTAGKMMEMRMRKLEEMSDRTSPLDLSPSTFSPIRSPLAEYLEKVLSVEVVEGGWRWLKRVEEGWRGLEVVEKG